MMSAIYFCPETSMILPTSSITGNLSMGTLLPENAVRTAQEYYAIPASYPHGIHHPGLQHAIPGLISEYELNNIICHMNRFQVSSTRGHMPEWLFDEEGNFTVTLQDVIELDLLFICVRDKRGSQFIQDNFPGAGTPLRKKLYDLLFDSQSIYNLAMDMFGNFVIQKMIAEAGEEYGHKMCQMLSVQAADLAFNRFSCRVVQKALDTFTPAMLAPMLQAFRGYVLAMGTEQSANHVLQKIIDVIPPSEYRFIVEEMCSGGTMDRLVCNKFGCRVVQYCVESLSKDLTGDVLKIDCIEATLIRSLMDRIARKAFRYSQDEFANYIIQYIIKHPLLGGYRDRIIKTALMGSIVILSQAKYSSHVIEQALENASEHLLSEMIKEAFSTSVNPKNGRDCLDQMLFDQFGNYIIQRLLNMAIQIRHGKRPGNAKWFDALSQRVIRNAQALLKYSSGKKIIETVSCELGYPIV